MPWPSPICPDDWYCLSSLPCLTSISILGLPAFLMTNTSWVANGFSGFSTTAISSTAITTRYTSMMLTTDRMGSSSSESPRMSSFMRRASDMGHVPRNGGTAGGQGQQQGVELFHQPAPAHGLHHEGDGRREQRHDHRGKGHHQVFRHALRVARGHRHQRRPHGNHGGHH